MVETILHINYYESRFGFKLDYLVGSKGKQKWFERVKQKCYSPMNSKLRKENYRDDGK